jgi:hypothetical protein
MKVPRCEKLQDGWSVSDQGQSRIQENHAHHGCKKKEEGEKTNELAKSCNHHKQRHKNHRRGHSKDGPYSESIEKTLQNTAERRRFGFRCW